MIGWIQDVLELHTIIDWLTMLALLVVAGSTSITYAILWLGRSVERQFRQHDEDLRSEVMKVNSQIEKLGR